MTPAEKDQAVREYRHFLGERKRQACKLLLIPALVFYFGLWAAEEPLNAYQASVASQPNNGSNCDHIVGVPADILVQSHNGVMLVIVEDGDTVVEILQEWGLNPNATNINAVASTNSLSNPSSIFVGQRLLIPTTCAQVTASSR